ncbi:ATP-binding cassette domain-containing protein, partial [Leifsonia sp. SIMBA_070]|uniref:ATP-binding cassette domain-containing protein n=1 Tax=Leifsonia sp. SIMBA_070 TaxID=3085810 RepID=UPI00397AD65C
MISVTGVSKSYGPQLVVDGVSTDIKEGGITSIIGPNGAGKSTTIRVLLGLA